MTDIISLTDAAAEHIKGMLVKDKNAQGFRLSIKKTGCSGYAYQPTLVEKIMPEDIHFTTENGVEVYVDPKCTQFIKDLVIDYVEDNQIGIKQKRLVFINPNEKNRCGCGESFTVDE